MDHKHWKITKVETLPQSEAEITGEITLSFLDLCRKEAIDTLGKTASLPGFRKGHVPEEMLVKQIGEMAILEESAEVALGKEYAHIIEGAKLSVIGRPSVSITKLAPGVPLEFKIRVALEPKFDLPNYQKIAKDIAEEPEDNKEIDKEVAGIVKELKERKIEPKLEEGKTLEEMIKENLLKEKEHRTKEKRRIKIIEKLIAETKMEVPNVLIESELSKMISQFTEDVTRSGMKWGDYLKKVKKSEEDLRKEWREKALERAKAELVTTRIAEVEKIEPKTEEVEHETKHLLEHYPDADPLRARIYIYTQLRNQKVLEFLEAVK